MLNSHWHGNAAPTHMEGNWPTQSFFIYIYRTSLRKGKSNSEINKILVVLRNIQILEEILLIAIFAPTAMKQCQGLTQKTAHQKIFGYFLHKLITTSKISLSQHLLC